MDPYAYRVGVGNPDPDSPDWGNAFHSLTWNADARAWEYRPRTANGCTIPVSIADQRAPDSGDGGRAGTGCEQLEHHLGG